MKNYPAIKINVEIIFRDFDKNFLAGKLLV